MNTEELNEFIGNYIKNNNTRTALMLTAPWGAGKSYYINNVLSNYLKEEINYEPIIVSLYGIKNLNELNKNLYIELRTKLFKNRKNIRHNTEFKQSLFLFGKTIVKGLTSYYNLNLNINDKDFEKLLKSINLKNKIIIFEDIERCEINILELMGYFNSFVEQDNVKTLLIANENEIFNHEKNTVKNEKDKNYTSEDYLKIKEKTVQDTIYFMSNTHEAVKNIILKYSSLNEFVQNEYVNEICDIIGLNANIRTFIFACQKTNEILNHKFAPKNINIEIKKIIFFSIILLSIKMKTGNAIKWEENKSKYMLLGKIRYPLFKICYDYILTQTINKNEYANIYNVYDEYKLYNENTSSMDKDIYILQKYYINKQIDVEVALRNIEEKLKSDKLSYYAYGKLANYLFCIQYDLEFDVENLKELVLNNLKRTKKKLNSHYLLNYEIEITDEKTNEEFLNFNNKIIEIIEKNEYDVLYNPSIDNVEQFIIYVNNNFDSFYYKKAFAKNINIEKLLITLKQCNPKQIYDVYGAFKIVYDKWYYEFVDDKANLKKLYNGIVEIMETEIDKVKKLQFKWFKKYLAKILSYVQN